MSVDIYVGKVATLDEKNKARPPKGFGKFKFAKKNANGNVMSDERD